MASGYIKLNDTERRERGPSGEKLEYLNPNVKKDKEVLK